MSTKLLKGTVKVTSYCGGYEQPNMEVGEKYKAILLHEKSHYLVYNPKNGWKASEISHISKGIVPPDTLVSWIPISYGELLYNEIGCKSNCKECSGKCGLWESE
jgi:hypothetical protein